MRLLYVVHRYAPFPGGSEIYVQNMAEESQRRGHEVMVFCSEHKGDLNGVRVTHDAGVLTQAWDLIIVHGGGVNVQDFVLSNASRISSPILYLLILPNTSDLCIQALRDCDYIGCSTEQDWKHCWAQGVTEKCVEVRHGINWQQCMGESGFKKKHGITGTMFLSCGGYWPNKMMKQLADLFESAKLDATLVTTGYDNRNNLMPVSRGNIQSMLIDDRTEVLSAIRDADCVLMHSYQEGFGLVLLEAMLNQTPWIAREIAGAKLMSEYGSVYDSDAQLVTLLRQFDRKNYDIRKNYEYVVTNHLISNTVDDIEVILKRPTIL